VGDRAEVIIHPGQQMRLYRPGEVQKEHGRTARPVRIAAPEQTGDTCAQQVDQANRVLAGK